MILNAFVPSETLWATVLFTRKGSGKSLWVGVFAWDPSQERPVPELQERVVLDPAFGEAQIWTYDKPGEPGKCYEELLKLFNHTLLDIPEDFDLPALVDANEAIVYDYNNKQIFSKAHPLISGKPIVRPSEGQVSDMGRWLSQADQYAKGPEGETEGPSGLSFL